MMMMMMSFWKGGGGGGKLPNKKVEVLVKNAVLVSLMVFSLNGSATETLVAPFRVSS